MYLPAFGWYRVDARGNKPGVDAQFCPPKEMLAWPPHAEGEFDFPGILVDPVPIVMECLSRFDDWKQVEENLPDIAVIEEPQNLATARDGEKMRRT